MTDWTITKNYQKEIKCFQRKPENEKVVVRITFLTNPHQKNVIDAYCKKTGMSYSDAIREALAMYFKSQNFDIAPASQQDENQLKIFNQNDF